MTRAIAIISCFIVALFLVPIQGECNEIPEAELETEVYCCVVVNSLSLSQITEKQPKLSLASDIIWRYVCVSVKIPNHIFRIPARILNCVFRE